MLVNTQEKHVHVEYKVLQCYKAGSRPLLIDIIIFIYLSLLQFAGIILALQTRKVKISALNDSKSVTALIYISSILLVAMVFTAFLLRGYINISAAVFSGGIITMATLFLVSIFIPKVHVKGFSYHGTEPQPDHSK